MASFYTGVAAIEVGEDERASGALNRFVQLAPREPAAAANLGIIAFQQRRFEDAWSQVERALADAPENGRIRILAALIERARGNMNEAIDHARRVPDNDESALRARFLLAQLLEQRGGPGDAVESRRVLDAMLESDSAGAFLLVASARHAARQDDRDALLRALDRLETLEGAWAAADRARLERVRAAAARPADAGAELTLLAASLETMPAYARDRDAIVISELRPDIVITAFLRLPAPSWHPAEPDTALRFVVRTIDGPQPVREVRPVWAGDRGPRLALLGPDAVWLAGDSADVQRVPLRFTPAAPDQTSAVAAFDFNHDFRLDLAVAGSSGLRLLRQEADGRFVPVEGAVPANTRTRAFAGVWPADTDLDGDVDLVVAARGDVPFVLRNRGDGTFTEARRFEGLTDARDFIWGDLDDDGVPDATFIDAAGRVRVFHNPRQDLPSFVPRDVPSDLNGARAIALGDLDGVGRFALLILRSDGALLVSSFTGEGWITNEVARWEGALPEAEPARLLIADLDNNGAVDVLASAVHTQIWLADSAGTLVPHETLPFAATAASDLTGGGRIELLGIDTAGRPVRSSSRPARDYYALTLIPRATDQPGDRRINTFGIGGEAEIRAGMSYQKQPITAPIVHFGIGPQTGVTVARIFWPNGTAQAEFDLLASQGRPIVAEQRLKGSCPWLFAFDGETMRFVTDVAWRTALGLRINAYGSSAVVHSEDRVRIRGDQLVARDGFYELSVTGELWESHFFDHVALMVVDHPADSEIFVDERFVLPPPDPEIRATGLLSPIARAWDDGGRDVTALVQARDERYVDTFELGEFQGVARNDHYVEVDLGTGADANAMLLLVAHGWLQPTDGSINFALGQGRHSQPRGLRVEVPDGRGGWSVLHADLGMPAGKTKTVLVDLAGAFKQGTPRRVRLHTNMEIYWDHIAWTVVRPEAMLRVTRLLPDNADLRFRGFSRVRRAGRRAPEIPDYEVAGTAPLWSDLTGHHTRFGDVLPLLREVDDRYVIMNAGDEMQLRFEALPAPEEGWVRDYVFVSDAWVKDGDFNNGFSSTLLPLPYHGLADYATPPRGLEDDAAYRRHPGDWQEYHTRYVTSMPFRHALSRN